MEINLYSLQLQVSSCHIVSTMAITLMKQVRHDITFTRNRKQVVTSRKDAGAAEQELEHLAEHMTHSRHTQNLYYDCSDKIDRSIEVFKQLQQGRSNPTSTIVRPSPPDNDDQQSQSVTEPSPLVSQEGAVSQTLSTDDQRIELSSTANISSSTASVVRPKSLSLFSSSSTHSRRAGYIDEQEKAISRLFRNYIREGRILVNEIRSVRKAYPDDSACLSGCTEKQLVDKIRCLAKPSQKN